MKYYEEMESPNQDLTFEAAAKAFQKYGTEFSPGDYRTLGLIQNGGTLFTNLALLISDQCEHTTKVAVFDNKANTTFTDHKEFRGSIFTQFENTYSYLRLCSKTSSIFNGLERIDKSDYPDEALCEAILNALIHRDYSFSGSIIINVNPEKMEFVSIGGLTKGLSLDDIRLGISRPRNENLAEIFHLLRLIERCGTGIRRIYDLYGDCLVKPEIIVTKNGFKLLLPNINEMTAQTPEEATTFREEMLDLREKLLEAEASRIRGVKPYSLDEVNQQLDEIINGTVF